MEDILQEFEEEKVQVDPIIRLVGISRIPLILIMIVSIVSTLLQLLDALSTSFSAYMVGYITATAVIGILASLAIFYTVKQLRLEIVLSPKAYLKSKYRWASNAFNIIILAMITTLVVQSTGERTNNNAFWAIMIFFYLFCLSALIADIGYYINSRKSKLTPKNLP